jgi:glycosyltransferase involved in cell wall biosynthesis
MLVRKGHEVTVLTTNSNLDEELDVPLNRPVDIDGVQVWYFGVEDPFKKVLPFFTYMSKSVGFLYAPELGNHLGRVTRDFDLVHTHLPFVYPTYAGARAARTFKKPLFYHQRGVLDPERLKFRSFKKNLYISAFERKIMKRATTLIALNEAEVQSYRQLGIRTPCSVVANGIDADRYLRTDRASPRHFHFPPQSIVILFLGRLHPTKGADKLLDAFLRIHHAFPNAFLVMAGPDEFKIESSMRSVIQQAGASERVLFPGMISGEAKLELLARADLFCLPSIGEGFSVAILEALASETAVLISPGCHFPEIEAHKVGRIVSTDPSTMAEVMAEMLASPETLNRMGKTGRRFVIDHYSVEKITNDLLSVYAEGVDRHKNTQRMG